MNPSMSTAQTLIVYIIANPKVKDYGNSEPVDKEQAALLQSTP